jgi:RNA polymerase sigma factor (sigma-70 family)
LARREGTGAGGPTPGGSDPEWSDERLVRACLDGDQRAWSALVDKYKHLIYGIAIRRGASPEDAADIFQSVCLELYSKLPQLRNTAALRGWLTTVTAHQSFHWKRRQLKRQEREQSNVEIEALGAELPAPQVTDAAEHEQMVREAIAGLPARCKEMIRLLFFVEPPLPYRDVAQRLGLATGSIGFIRGRCLQRLQKALRAMGF